MPDWLLKSFNDSSVAISWQMLIARLATALVMGALVAGIYYKTRRPANVAATFPATLVLLAVLIAMVTQVIGDNIARAFSLVGALSIVRFRTVVRDTKDTAFVIFAVVVGMAVGAGQLAVAGCGMVTVAVAAALFRDPPGSSALSAGVMWLVVRIGWSAGIEARLQAALAEHVAASELLSIDTIRHGAAAELSYWARLSPGVTPVQIVADLSRVEGVQSVELRQVPDEG
jgi:hypothetical protein